MDFTKRTILDPQVVARAIDPNWDHANTQRTVMCPEFVARALNSIEMKYINGDNAKGLTAKSNALAKKLGEKTTKRP